MKVIIPDAQSRKAFDVINILKRVNGYDLLLFAPPGSNRLLRAIHGQRVHPLNMENYGSFREDLLSAIESDSASEYIWMAVSEDTTLYFYELLETEPRPPIRYLLPDRPMFELVRNKARFQAFCEANDLPVPASFSADNLKELVLDFRPVIAKKRIGAGSVGMKYVDRPDQVSLLDEIDIDEYLVQEAVVSTRNVHGFFCVAKDGEVIAWHGHERLRTFPEKGGVTVFSRTQYDKECRKVASRLIRETNWSGFAMVELLHDDRAGKWKIIELNPRLWGSVMLSEFCGAMLLSNYVKIVSGDEPDTGETQANRYIRWIFPFEVISLLKGVVSVGEFLNRRGLKVCYINFTYSGAYQALLYQAYLVFNWRSITRFFKKLLQ